MRQYHLIFILSFLLAKPLQAQLNLDTCQLQARNNYPLIQQFDLIEKSTDYSLDNAKKALLPRVSLNAIGAYMISGFPATSLPGVPAEKDSKMKLIGIAQVNQAIWDGGATRTQKEIIQAGSAVEKANIEVALFNIRERVNQLFFGILLMDEQLNHLTTLNKKLQLNLDAAKQLKDNGYAYQIDVSEVKAEMLNVEQKEIELRYARKGFTTMLGYLTATTLTETTTLQKPDYNESVLLQPIARPELAVFESNRHLANAQIKMDKVGNLPKIGIMGAGLFIEPGAKFATSSLSSLSMVGVSLSWNTDNIYKSNNNRKLHQLQLDKINNQESNFNFNTHFQLKQAFADVAKQQAILKKDAEIITLKEEIVSMYQVKYANGLCSMNEIISAQNKQTEALNNQSLHAMQLLISLYHYKTTNGY